MSRPKTKQTEDTMVAPPLSGPEMAGALCWLSYEARMARREAERWQSLHNLHGDKQTGGEVAFFRTIAKGMESALARCRQTLALRDRHHKLAKPVLTVQAVLERVGERL